MGGGWDATKRPARAHFATRSDRRGAGGSSRYPELHDGPGVGADPDLGLRGAARRVRSGLPV